MVLIECVKVIILYCRGTLIFIRVGIYTDEIFDIYGYNN